MALLDGYDPILREVLNYPYDKKVRMGKQAVNEIIPILERRYSRTDSVTILKTLASYALRADSEVKDAERQYFNSVFSGYCKYDTLSQFSAMLNHVGESAFLKAMYHAFGQAYKELNALTNMLFWLFCTCDRTATIQELDKFKFFLDRKSEEV